MHARIAMAIKEARGSRSAQWLADRTAELGYPVTRAQIANYETGRKQTLDIAELLVLAAALDTSPVSLVYPGPYDEAVAVLPVMKISELQAAQWMSAFTYLHPPGQIHVGGAQYWLKATAGLRAWRQLNETSGARSAYLARSAAEGRDVDPEQVAFYDRQIRDLRAELGLGDDG